MSAFIDQAGLQLISPGWEKNKRNGKLIPEMDFN